MNRLLIIDGHNLHFQIFFGIRAKQKKRSGKTAQFGESFAGAVRRIIRIADPTHVVVIFDGEHENPRRALFPAYKANRPDYDLLPDEENPYLKLPDALAALDRMGVKYIETTTVEADDLIALCCEKFKAAAEIVVCSHDHDFYQLIGSRVRIMGYSGKQGTYYGEGDFREEFHISPRRFADYKALTGDKSDNIPGVRGVGNITAARLINRFGGVDEIISRTGEVRQKKLRRCLVEGAERMQLNYKLVKLGGEQYGAIELPWSFSELAFTLKDDKKRTKAQAADRSTENKKQKNQSTRRSKVESRSDIAVTAPLTESKAIEAKEKPLNVTETQQKSKNRRPRRKKRQNARNNDVAQAAVNKTQLSNNESDQKPSRLEVSDVKPKPINPQKNRSELQNKQKNAPSKVITAESSTDHKDKTENNAVTNAQTAPNHPKKRRRRGQQHSKQSKGTNSSASQGDRIQTRKEAWND